MIFLVDAALFRAGAARDADLVALLRAGAMRGHTLWVVDDPNGVASEESILVDEWTKRLGRDLGGEVRWLREALRNLGAHAVTRGAAVVMVVGELNPADTNRLPAGRVQLEHGGGGDLPRLIEHSASGGSEDPLGLGPESWRVSHFVVCDRDRRPRRGAGSRTTSWSTSSTGTTPGSRRMVPGPR